MWLCCVVIARVPTFESHWMAFVGVLFGRRLFAELAFPLNLTFSLNGEGIRREHTVEALSIRERVWVRGNEGGVAGLWGCCGLSVVVYGFVESAFSLNLAFSPGRRNKGGGRTGSGLYAGLNARSVRLISDERHSSVPPVLLRSSRISMSAKPVFSTMAR